MTEWKYKLDFEGKVLRSLINKEETIENIIAIYNQIIVCLESWKKRLRKPDKENWEYDIESMIEDLQELIVTSRTARQRSSRLTEVNGIYRFSLVPSSVKMV